MQWPVTESDLSCRPGARCLNASALTQFVHRSKPSAKLRARDNPGQTCRRAVRFQTATAHHLNVQPTNSSVVFNVRDNPSAYQPNALNRNATAVMAGIRTITARNAQQRIFLRHVERLDKPTASCCFRSYSRYVACNFAKAIERRLETE